MVVEAVKLVNEALGDGRLFKTSVSVLERVALPDAARVFLREAGLPRGEVFGGSFAPTEVLPLANIYAVDHGYCQEMRGRLADSYTIGDNYGILLVVDRSMGEVLQIDARGELETLRVNSSVESFGAGLAAYATLSSVRAEMDSSERASRLAHKLREIDPDYPSDWWPLIVEEVGYGLL